MASNKLHGTGRRRGTIDWCHERRLALHMLQGYRLSPTDKDRVFGTVFGLNEISQRALRSQYKEKGQHQKAHLWSPVLSEPTTAEEIALRQNLRDRIANAVLQVNGGSAEQVSSQVNNGSPEQISNDTITYEEPEPESAVPEPPPSKKRKRERPERRERRMVMRREAFVVIPRVSPQQVNAPRLSVPPTPPETPGKILYHRRIGGPVSLTPKAIASIPDAYLAPPEEELHPRELPALFYRFWSEDPPATHCLNSRDGFIAGKYYDSNMIWHALPTGYAIDPTDVFNHIEAREGKPSPFVSVSSNLNWSLNNAIKESKTGKKIAVSVILSARLNRKEVFYARPLMNRLRKHKPFTGGKWMYGSTNEFWVWNSIPKTAILKTFTLDQIMEMSTASSAGLGRVLRLQTLARVPDIRLREALEAGNVAISDVVAAAIGDLSQFFGLSSKSTLEELSFFVADVVHGFAIKLPYHTATEWNDYAAVYSHSFSLGSIRPISFSDQMKLRAAFLQGLSVALRDPKVTNYVLRSSAPFLQKLQRKITSVGLEDPAALTQDLEDARLQALQYKKSFQRRLQPTRSQMLLEDGIEGAEDQDDEEMSDMISQFELNDDGIVV